MELGFIFIILVAIVLVILVFKFIKKLIFAVFTLFFVVFLVFAGVLTLAYLDVKELSQQKEIDFYVLKLSDEKAEFGVEFSLENGKLEQESFKSIKSSVLSDLESKEIDKDEGIFAIFVDNESMFHF